MLARDALVVRERLIGVRPEVRDSRKVVPQLGRRVEGARRLVALRVVLSDAGEGGELAQSPRI